MQGVFVIREDIPYYGAEDAMSHRTGSTIRTVPDTEKGQGEGQSDENGEEVQTGDHGESHLKRWWDTGYCTACMRFGEGFKDCYYPYRAHLSGPAGLTEMALPFDAGFFQGRGIVSHRPEERIYLSCMGKRNSA
jgi:hypothetical protein